RWRISVLTDRLFRGEYARDGGFEDRASSFALHRRLPAVEYGVRRAAAGVVVTTERAVLRYDGGEFSTSGLTVSTLGRTAAQWRYGERSGNLGGTTRTLDHVDGRVELSDGILSRTGIAALDDSESFVFDAAGWVAPRHPGRRDLYVFAHGLDVDAALADFYAISGLPARLPRWALGNWWSRYYPYRGDEYLELMDRFATERVPLSVAVLDMDWHRVGSVPEDYGPGWTGFSWERSLIPDPERFLAELGARGLRTALNLHPADGVRAYEDHYADVVRAVGADPATGAVVAFAPTDPRFVAAYFEALLRPIEEQGVDFWWMDWQQGSTSSVPGVDPLWVLNHYHFLDATRAGRSRMLLSRYAGPGSHRYAVGFSGDTVISWASLRFQPEFTATAANIGYGWWSHDVGGHADGVRDDELAVRWVQYGVFSPICRLHSANNPFIRKEPWAYAPEPAAAMVAALRLRHRLVPYLHTMNRRAAAGVPLVRPMYHLHPDRPEAYEVPNQYMFGTQLLVAPVTEPRDPVTRRGRVTVWLPPGLWIDVFTGTSYQGDRHAELYRDLNTIPVLLGAGGIVPLAGAGEIDASRSPERLELLVAPGASGHFDLVEDRGDAGSDRVATTTITWAQDHGELCIDAVRGDVDAVPAGRTWVVTFLAEPPGGPVTVDGVQADVDVAAGRFSVTVRSRRETATVVRLGGLSTPGASPAAVRELLDAAQLDHRTKLQAWQAA
ncbi:MAG: glycoside hydrolase, partial [Actinobacteria bacterium]|nr:glycoside hydrolase [Actinomycetota bacterium]